MLATYQANIQITITFQCYLELYKSVTFQCYLELYKSVFGEKLRLVSFKKSFIPVGMLCSSSETIQVCISILLISFKINLKLVFTTKNRNNDLSSVFAMSLFTKSNQNDFEGLSYTLVKKYRNCSFWKLNNRFWRSNSFITTFLRYLWKSLTQAYGFSGLF